MIRFALPARESRPQGSHRPWSRPWAASVALAAAALAGAALPAAAADAALPVPGGTAVAGWGENDQGQLGTAAPAAAATPVLANLPAGTRIAQVAPGCTHTVALTTAGAVLAWGANGTGQLGNGTVGGTSPSPAPVKLPPGVTIRSVSGGCGFSLAVTADGHVYSWGANAAGELGNGTTGAASGTPALVALPAGVTVLTVAAGETHALAVTTAGQVYAWGDNSAGELGNGTKGNPNGTPALVRLPAGVRVTSAAGGVLNSHVVTTAGTVLGWGDNSHGDLGSGSTSTAIPSPVLALIPSGLKVRSVFAGCSHTLAVTANGELLAWGDNENGQLGIGSFTDARLPVHVRLPQGGRAVTAGGGCQFSEVLTGRGQMLAFGGSEGIGDGRVGGDSTVPVQVHLPAGQVAIGTGGSPVAGFGVAVLRPAR